MRNLTVLLGLVPALALVLSSSPASLPFASAHAQTQPPLPQVEAPPRSALLPAQEHVHARYQADIAAVQRFRPTHHFWRHIFTIPDGSIIFGSAEDGRLLATFPTQGNWAREGVWEDAALEDTLGVELFTRAARGVTPTREGVLLRSHAEQIIASVERIRAEIVPPERLSSLLRIGAAETIVQTWLPEFLRRLGTTYPRLKIEITVDISLNLREALLDRALDLAFLMGPVSEYSVDNLELPPVPLA